MHCDQCGAEVRSGARFCDRCGSELRQVVAARQPGSRLVSGTAATTTKPPAPFHRRGVGTVLFLLVFVFALMPWVTVSCAGVEIKISGYELATGNYGESAGTSPTSDGPGIEPFALAALIAAAVGVLLAFGRSEEMRALRIAAGVGGVASVIGLLIKIEKDVADAAAEAGVAVGIDWEFGFWLSMLAFVGAVASQWLPESPAEAESGSAGARSPTGASGSRDEDGLTAEDEARARALEDEVRRGAG